MNTLDMFQNCECGIRMQRGYLPSGPQSFYVPSFKGWGCVICGNIYDAGMNRTTYDVVMKSGVV